MSQLFSDAARTELSGTMDIGATSLAVVDGALFPTANVGSGALDTGDWFKAVLQDASGIEIVYVRTHATSTTPNAMSNILRGQDGTSARAWDAGTTIGLRPTAGDATRWETAAETVDADVTKVTKMQAETEGNTTFFVWSPQRVWQAIAKWWEGASTAFGRSMVNAANAGAARTLLEIGASLDGASAEAITGGWDFQTRIKVKASKYVVNNLGSISGSKTIDLSAATEFTGTITGNTTFNFTNAPVSGESQVVYLRLTNAGDYTIAWPGGTLFPGGVPPEFTEAGVDVVGCKYDPTAAKYIIMPIAMDIQVEA